MILLAESRFGCVSAPTREPVLVIGHWRSSGIDLDGTNPELHRIIPQVHFL
jgi:hypothetical protein